MRMRTALPAACLGLCAAVAAADVYRSEANNGRLVMEDVPPIPQAVVDDLNQFQNTRAARFRAWNERGDGLYVATRFGVVEQLHQVGMPGGARRQVTYLNEPVGDVLSRPGSRDVVYTMDVGGSEFTQILLYEPESGRTTRLTDGESRNGPMAWDREGRRLAYTSTRRNGAANDVWIMDPESPPEAAIALESPDGTRWSPLEFSANGRRLLVLNYVSIADSRAVLLDLDSGARTLLAGGGGDPSSNYPVAFDDGRDGFWLITSQGADFQNLAWQALEDGAAPEIVTADIGWDVTHAVLSRDRRRLAFVVNEEGRSRVCLMDARTRRYRPVDTLPVGVAYDLAFSPSGDRLAMTLNSAVSPSDAYVLELGDDPLEYGRLVRWTESEVGGLDASLFREPALVHYPTFDTVGGKRRQIPAWVYKPHGAGPFPVVVAIHGGPEGQSRPVFSSTYQMWLHKLGVAVVLPNVRGSNGYGKAYLALDNGVLREDSVRDIGALLDWIAAQPDLDAGRVAVYGRSYGGYMTLASTVHYSDRLAAAIDVVGISNFVTFLENTQDYRRDLRRAEYGDERDPAMRAHLQKISPANNADRIGVPIFVVQGQNDPRVPVTESTQMVAALRERGNTVWFMNALNEGHGYNKKENRDVYQQATVMFLRKYLLDDANQRSTR